MLRFWVVVIYLLLLATALLSAVALAWQLAISLFSLSCLILLGLLIYSSWQEPKNKTPHK